MKSNGFKCILIALGVMTGNVSGQVPIKGQMNTLDTLKSFQQYCVAWHVADKKSCQSITSENNPDIKQMQINEDLVWVYPFDWFSKLSEGQRLHVMAHELAHVKYKHHTQEVPSFGKIEDFWQWNEGRESLADRYAYSKLQEHGFNGCQVIEEMEKITRMPRLYRIKACVK